MLTALYAFGSHYLAHHRHEPASGCFEAAGSTSWRAPITGLAVTHLSVYRIEQARRHWHTAPASSPRQESPESAGEIRAHLTDLG